MSYSHKACKYFIYKKIEILKELHFVNHKANYHLLKIILVNFKHIQNFYLRRKNIVLNSNKMTTLSYKDFQLQKYKFQIELFLHLYSIFLLPFFAILLIHNPLKFHLNLFL